MSRNNFKTSQIASEDLAPFAFIIFAVIGTVLIILTKWMEFPTFVIILIPIAVLLGYTFVSWTLPRFERPLFRRAPLSSYVTRQYCYNVLRYNAL